MEQYIKIFPTDRQYIKSDTIQVKESENKLIDNKNTNMHEFIRFCLDVAKSY